MAVTKLRLALLEMRCPQYTVAAAAQMHPSRLSEYVLGKKKIAPHHLTRLATVLQCKPEDLIGFAEPVEDVEEVKIDSQ